MFSILVGNRFGYTFAILFEIAVYYLLCAFLYQSRWDRRLFVVVTNYAILYSASYWGDALCIFFLDLTYEEYVWNIPLYSVAFILRLLAIFSIALLIQKYHQPLSVGKQARAWVPLSAVFPISTLLIIWQIYTFPHEQQIWQICLLILNVVDVVAILLLDHLEQSAINREKLVAAAERAHVQDAPVVNKAPFFPVVIEHFPRIIGHRFPCSSCRSSKQRCNSPCCLFTGQSRHFDFTAVILILEIKGQAPHLRKVLHPELPAAAR